MTIYPSEQPAAHTCLECGEALAAEDSCQSIFDAFLALEFTDPAYGAVHFLTVSCFLIQHGRYSDTALTWIEQQLRANLEEGRSTESIRRQAAEAVSPGGRDWKVLRQPGERALPHIAWSVTIADVAGHFQDAADYCDWVKRWAHATLREMQPALPFQG